MNILLAYGSSSVGIDVPPNVTVDSFAASAVVHPISYPDFEAAFKPENRAWCESAERVLIVVNDAYRHTPTSVILNWLDQLFPSLLGKALFLVATGSHQKPTPEQLKSIFGDRFKQIASRVCSHDATDHDSMVNLGSDSFGEPVLVNNLVLEFDRILIIGSVEPHYFAGFTGGRKSIFPGLNDLATIERNHNLANSLEAAPLKLKGNPVAEHLESLLRFLSAHKVLSIQLVADAKGLLAGVFVGDIKTSFCQAVELATRLYARPVTQPYDLALCELLAPLNKNLYQTQKALENCQAAVADGGAAVVIAPCDEGVGSVYFFKLADSWDKEKNLPRDGVARFGSHKLSRVNAIGRRIHACIHCNLPDDTVQRVYYEPVADINGFVLRLAQQRKSLRLALVHDAGHTVLQMVNKS